MDINVLVTGGCGFIGSHIVDELLKNNANVYVIDKKKTWINNNVKKYFHIDINNKNDVEKVFSEVKPNVCLHLAGLLGTSECWDYVDKTVNTNIIGANNIYIACGENKCDIITVDVGSRWLSPYTITKTCSAEFALAYANKYKVKCGLLRIFNVYGPRQSTKIIKICPIFIQKALTNQNLEIWGNKNTDLIYVTDVAKAFTLSVFNFEKINFKRDIYIGSGNKLTTSEFAEKIIEKVNSGKILHMKPRLGEEKTDAGFMNNTTAYDLLGWKPSVNLSDGLDKTIQYYKDKNIQENYGLF